MYHLSLQGAIISSLEISFQARGCLLKYQKLKIFLFLTQKTVVPEKSVALHAREGGWVLRNKKKFMI